MESKETLCEVIYHYFSEKMDACIEVTQDDDIKTILKSFVIRANHYAGKNNLLKLSYVVKEAGEYLHELNNADKLVIDAIVILQQHGK